MIKFEHKYFILRIQFRFRIGCHLTKNVNWKLSNQIVKIIYGHHSRYLKFG